MKNKFVIASVSIALLIGALIADEAVNTSSRGLEIGTIAADRIGFHGTAPAAQRSGANGTALTDSTGGGVSNATLADGLTVTSITDSSGGAASGTIAAATNIDTLTGTLTGTLDNALADLTAATAATVTGSLTGTPDGVLADVADIALSTAGGNTYTDAAVNTAVNTAILAVNLQLEELQVALNEVIADNAARKLVADKNFKEVQAELVTQRALNTVLVNAAASLAAKVNLLVTDDGTQNDNDAKIAELVNELRATLVAKGLHAGS